MTLPADTPAVIDVFTDTALDGRPLARPLHRHELWDLDQVSLRLRRLAGTRWTAVAYLRGPDGAPQGVAIGRTLDDGGWSVLPHVPPPPPRTDPEAIPLVEHGHPTVPSLARHEPTGWWCLAMPNGSRYVLTGDRFDDARREAADLLDGPLAFSAARC